jgi:hypothetical protein
MGGHRFIVHTLKGVDQEAMPVLKALCYCSFSYKQVEPNIRSPAAWTDESSVPEWYSEMVEEIYEVA